jgi:beta-galactosidase
MRDGFYASGLTQLSYHARPIEIDGDTVSTEVLVTGSKSAGFTHRTKWHFMDDGSVKLESRVVPHGTMPAALPRMGLSLRLSPSLERVRYYGRGPQANYIDRKSGSFFGIWQTTVSDMYENFVRPQANGHRSDVRWVEFGDANGNGVRFAASQDLYFSALHYPDEDLEFARHRAGQKRFRGELRPSEEVFLNLDVRQLGLGGASCGPRPLPQYVFPVREESWTLQISPLR